tara:strand:- start:34 stop:1011 length:978 start_codon:yes stop_codon:yes gene_type:complete
MATPSEYFDNAELDKIPVPDWEHLQVTSPSIKPTRKLNWNVIRINHEEGNITKEEQHTSEEIEALRLSFAAQVDEKEFPPAVRYRGKEYARPWELVYGYGRSEALRLLGTKGWFFTVLEGTEDALEDVQAQENERLPKRINEEVDMRKFLIQKVIDGKIEKSEKAIREKFRKVYPFRKKETENRVVPQVLSELGVKLPYILYTSTPKVQDWIDNHSRDEYVINNELDKERDVYSIVMKEGYQYRAVLKAYQTYEDTGKKTGVIFHCGAPTAKATLNRKRDKVLQDFKALRKTLFSCGTKIWPIEILGALPQDREKDNIKELITFY